ncbi:hypothetical protein RUMCAL_01866 [Ruminococcus callidus ATCC 27760]|uniref:Uncharacterized protein n=1 Tax=Ruminococcus callidus ATCC 27760 TaxID=411473 RepID=U2KRD3_9FIRM|nr:hypothetical protein RUMCAL_01866 [Ruminococcus callidus ATCC 27760]
MPCGKFYSFIITYVSGDCNCFLRRRFVLSQKPSVHSRKNVLYYIH